jgi:tetratricopeptide (TPR) repeat protein
MAEYIQVGRLNDAVSHGQKALKIDNSQYYVYYNLSIAQQRLGNLSDAYKMGRKSALMERNTVTLSQLGFVLKEMGWRVGDPNPPD